MGVWIEISDGSLKKPHYHVTPCVGVWIEILFTPLDLEVSVSSLPAWECGLKFSNLVIKLRIFLVTPCVGVWIEIDDIIAYGIDYQVTPCVGVWIEILGEVESEVESECHSLRGSVD